jgi:hypothetical protein
MENEITYTILGFRLWKFGFGIGLFPTEGTPTQVTCDFESALKYRKYLVGFYHTHPNMLNYPSNMDIRAFYAWGNCLGKTINCLIDGIDVEYSSMLAGDVWSSISNYKFETYPYEDKPDKHSYAGHAYKIGRFFFWKDL